MTSTTVAVDLGGTHVRVALVAADGTVLVSERRSTPDADPTPEFIPALIKEIVTAADHRPTPGRAVVGLPGQIDHDAEALVAAPNLPQAWIPKLTEAWLRDSTGLEVSLANDADLAAVGESAFGAGRAVRDVVYVTISTGVGAGVVVAERLVRGRFSGGEIGHTVIDAAAAAAGRPATVEEIGSGTAIERRAAEAGIEERGAALAELVRSGARPATDIWTAGIEAVGLGLANLAWIVAPQAVVVGGGVGRNHDLVNDTLAAQIARFGPTLTEPVRVVTAELGDDAGLVGAAAWWEAIGRG